MWVAISCSAVTVTYVLEIMNGVVRSCGCSAGAYGDPRCKHAARFYLDSGLLAPEPESGAPALAPGGYCAGRGWGTVIGKSGADFRFAGSVCEGAGDLPM